MTAYYSRQVSKILLPLADSVSILYPEQTILCYCDNGGTLDIGACCYLKRKGGPRKKSQNGRLVCLKSLDNNRSIIIRELINYLSQEVKSSGKRLTTLRSITSEILAYIDWLDTNNHSNLFTDKEIVKEGLRLYFDFLVQKVNTNNLNLNTAAKLQRNIVKFLSDFLNNEYLGSGLNVLRASKLVSQTTTPPSEKIQGQVLLISETLFDEITNFIITEGKYPFQIEIPNYLNWEESRLWIFPTVKWFMSPNELLGRIQMKNGYWAYDYFNGRLSAIEVISQNYSSKSAARLALRSAKNQINLSNNNLRHSRRISLALVAHNAS